MVNEKQAIDMIVSIISVVAGIIIFYFSVSGYDYISPKCANNTLRNSLTSIIALSAGVATSGVCYFGCMLGSDNCYSGVDRATNTSTIYFSISAVISFALIVSSSIVLAEAKTESCGGSNLKRNMGIVLGLSILIFLASAFGISVSQTHIWGNLGKGTSDANNVNNVKDNDNVTSFFDMQQVKN